MSNIRVQTIRLASTFPRGSAERTALLNALAQDRTAYDPGPDPLTYRAMLSEYNMGLKSAEEGATGQADPILSVSEATADTLILLKRIAKTLEQSGSVRVQPERFVAKLSSYLSKLLYNLGRAAGGAR